MKKKNLLERMLDKAKPKPFDITAYLLEDGYRPSGEDVTHSKLVKENIAVMLRRNNKSVMVLKDDKSIIDLAFIPRSQTVFEFLLKQGIEEA